VIRPEPEERGHLEDSIARTEKHQQAWRDRPAGSFKVPGTRPEDVRPAMSRSSAAGSTRESGGHQEKGIGE